MNQLPADLPEAARRYIEGLPKGRFAGFSMTPLDDTGVPAWMVGLFLDESHGLKGAMPSGYGYGTTDAQAIIGAVAEIAEMICPTLRLREEPRRIDSYDDLVREFGRDRVADPLTLGLPAGSPVTRATPLAWIEATRARDGARVWVPMDVAACDFFELPDGYQPFTTLITNGLGAGPDVEWAVGHGLLECLQRDGNGLLFRALDAGVLLDLEGADVGEDARALLSKLDRLGIEVLPKFATDEFGLTNLYVVGHDRGTPRVPIMLSACGEACDPDPRRALHKALLEFCSARVRKTYGHGPLGEALSVAPPGYVDDFVRTALPSLELEESRALRAMMDWTDMGAADLKRALDASVFSVKSRKPFASLPGAGLPPSTEPSDTRSRGRIARERLEAAGFDVLYVDCSPRDGAFGVVKVIVPNLEVETMSYYRIGERNTRKLIERGSPLIVFGEETEARRPVRLSPEAIERLRPLTGGRQPLFDTAEADRVVGPLYPLYREPEAHHVAYRLEQRAKRGAR
ncbi:YcaO-like family protein [Lichenibacterium dinghuense]|uniref:YcaO-like family protein n=1 Tax=Lichenibacterium dinghuense TaxID=2895977 RepID=UPI001F3DE5DA|nr:YcaO-like family protein [Lichenibacterium sp. 6Y81]